MDIKHYKKGDKRVTHAWVFYDWANSAYNLVIISALFPIFWDAITKGENGHDRVDFLGINFNNDSLISYVTAIAFMLVAIISPVLSGIADYAGNKKIFLKFFCYLGGFSTIALYFFDIENLFFGLLMYLLALLGFWSSLVFYNSYLPDIAEPKDHDALSAKGFSYGYIGSVILLLINLTMIMSQELPNERVIMMRYSFITVGVWWIGFSQYTYKYLPNFKNGKKITRDIVFKGFRELQQIWREIKNNLLLKRYLGAFFMYSMAVQTVMLIATYFGVEEINWGEGGATMGLIVSILLIQLLAVGGAFFTSYMAKKIGNINTLIGINFIWVIICLYAYTIHTPTEFYVTASAVGLVMGGIQSLSRSTYSKFLPQTEDTTSYFSFYDVAEKIGIVIGMLLYGKLSSITGNQRFAILFFVLFFVLGIVFLFRVPKKV